MRPAARKIAFRSQRRPNRIKSAPTAYCRSAIGTRPSNGPSSATMAASAARAAPAPPSAGRQPRISPTASTIVSASTGVLNFAFAAEAFFVGRVYYFLNSQHGWATWQAGLLSIVVVGPALGFVL